MLEVIKKRLARTLREIFFPVDVDWLYSVQAWLWTLEDIFAESRMKELLSIITSHDQSLCPDKWQYNDERSYPFSTETIDATIRSWQEDLDARINGRLWVYLKRTDKNEVMYTLDLIHTEEFPFSTVDIHLGEEYFKKRGRTEIFLELLEKLYFFCKAEYLVCFHTLDLKKKYMRYPKEGKNGENIPTFWLKPAAYMPAIGWLTIFGPRYAKLIDTRVKNVSAYRKQMSDGGIMLLTSKSPLEYGEKHTLKCEENLKQVLPSELFFNPSNPSGPYLSPDYPISCKKWTQKDEFELEVETHVYAPSGLINKIKLAHRPTGISVSRRIDSEEVDIVEQELLSELRELVKKSR